MALTNPRRRRYRSNNTLDAARERIFGAEDYSEPNDDRYWSSTYKESKPRRSKQVAKKKKTTRRKRSKWMSLVKQHGIKAAKKIYRGLKSGGKKRKKYTKRHYRKRVVVSVGKPHRKRRRASIRVKAGTPIKIYRNPRKRRYHRKHYRRGLLAVVNPKRRTKYGVRKDVLMQAGMVAAGFFGHRVLSNILTKQLAKWNIPQEVVDVSLPVVAYFTFNSKAMRNRVKYANELVIGAGVSAANRLLKKVLPAEWGQYLGDITSDSVLVLPGPSYPMEGYQVGAVPGVLGGDEPDPFLLGGYQVGDSEIEG